MSLFFNFDVMHGFQTIFPATNAWSCSWNIAAIKDACEIAAKEASDVGINYNHGPNSLCICLYWIKFSRCKTKTNNLPTAVI
ncbi:hypothetical protein FE296_26200 [Paenibacillus sp. UASWS1643]|nr:hypothetical protein FE296_26200 [Paenibacillus sp. UASWS1643]